ncbi:MAG: hypothetical protein U0359_19890 [Byssovorax sp.]
MRSSNSIRSLCSMLPRAAALVALTWLAGGCYARAGVVAEAPEVETDADVVWVERPPTNIEVYPHEVYAGTTVYLVDGRWYRRAGARWVVYRREPVELARRRAVHEQRREPRGYAHGHHGEHGYRR